MSVLSAFQRALSHSVDHQFQHVPVDWWDASAGVWRPSVVEASVCNDGDERVYAEIVAPFTNRLDDVAVSYVPKRVRISDLRPSRLVSEQLGQFFTTRYTLAMLDTLMPCIDRASAQEQSQLRKVLNDLVGIYTVTYDAWLSAFSVGSADGRSADEDAATDRTIDHRWLPPFGQIDVLATNPPSVDVFSAIDRDRRDGEINCSPVALWDEVDRLWRPTMMLGATGDETQFAPSSSMRVLEPGDPVRVVTVAGSLLQPLDIADICISLFAIPVLTRDFMRMHDALMEAGFDREQVSKHPFVVAFARMLRGAADEWAERYEVGMAGAAPEPRVIPLAPTAWGFTDGEV